MTILNKILNNIIVRFIIITIPLIIIIYFAYFYNGRHQKDINKLRIIDFYDLRVDISVNQLEEEFGEPYSIVTDYDEVKFIFSKLFPVLNIDG